MRAVETEELENEETVMELAAVKEAVNRGKNCLLVKLLTRKYTMKKIWRPIKPLCFYEMGARLMMAEFDDLNDKHCVVRDGPWNFDKCIILVKEFNEGQQLRNIQIYEASFWIRLHDLPLMVRNEYMRGLVGVALDKIKEVDIDYGEVE